MYICIVKVPRRPKRGWSAGAGAAACGCGSWQHFAQEFRDVAPGSLPDRGAEGGFVWPRPPSDQIDERRGCSLQIRDNDAADGRQEGAVIA